MRRRSSGRRPSSSSSDGDAIAAATTRSPSTASVSANSRIAPLIVFGQEQRPQERAVHAVAERQPLGPHAGGQLRERRGGQLLRPQQPVPGVDWVHFSPTIDGHFGQLFDGAPFTARSITSRAIFSTTMSK